MTDSHSKQQRSYNMSRIRSEGTSPEMIVRKFLFSKGMRYRLHDKRYPGKPDLVFPRYRVAVFINGCFWHMHENCPHFVMPKSNIDYWKTKLENNRIRDCENIRQLEASGWRVIVVWECELGVSAKEETLCALYQQIVGS